MTANHALLNVAIASQLAKLSQEIAALRADLSKAMPKSVAEPQVALRDRDYLSIAQAANYIGISRSTMYQLRLDRKLAKTDNAKRLAFAQEFEINGRTKFRKDELDAWLTGRSGAVGRRNGKGRR